RGTAEALALAAQHADAIDLLLTDLWLPDGAGSSLLDDLRSTRPDLDAVIISGHSADHPAVRDATARERTLFVQKPFDADMLIARIRRVLAIRTPSASHP